MEDDKFQEDIWLDFTFGSLLSMEALICGFAVPFGNQAHSLVNNAFISAAGDLNCEAEKSLESFDPICCPTHAPIAGQTKGIGSIVPAIAPATAPAPPAK